MCHRTTGIRLSRPAAAAGQVVWAFVTVITTPASGYKGYNGFRTGKLSLVPGHHKALVYRLPYATSTPAVCWLILFTGGMFSASW